MALPRPPEARLYYRAARQRFEDAQLLLGAGRTTGAVYMAGYTVECVMKALVLAGVAVSLRRQIHGEFRGNRGHSIAWLGDLFRRHTGGSIPRDVTRHLARVDAWTTDLRYETGVLGRREANEFMRAVTAISAWADGRM